MPKAAILMATYNGEAHIKEQLDSIIQQTHSDWELYVSDDGSRDNTVSVLTAYQQKEPRIREIIANPGPHGPFCNYYHLIRHLKSLKKTFDYVFYCDQDDIWLPNKIEKQIARLSACDSTKPALCNANMALTNGEGIPTGKSLSDYTDLNLRNPYDLFFKHRYIWGTAMAHNQALWDMLEIPHDISDLISHDNFIGKYAVCYGSVVHEPEPLVLYRRHGDNVSSLPIEHKITKTFSLLSFYRYYKDVAFCSLYFIFRAPVKTGFMKDYTDAVLKGGWKAWQVLQKYNICVTQGALSKLVFTLFFVAGLIRRNEHITNKEYLYEKNQ